VSGAAFAPVPGLHLPSRRLRTQMKNAAGPRSAFSSPRSSW